jgi:zinc-binding alcohol dehydrogenase/oxidoreductase
LTIGRARFNGVPTHNALGQPLESSDTKTAAPTVPPRRAIIGDWVVIDSVMTAWGNDPRGQSAEFNMLGQLPYGGTFAEYVAVPIDRCHPLPSHLTIEEASTIPCAALTAYRALVTQAQARPESVVLITGIGGGVAVWALQLAIAIGCHVVVTSSSQAKIDAAIKLGALTGWNYTKDGWYRDAMTWMKSKNINGLDCVVDGAGGPSLNYYIHPLLRTGGRIAIYGYTISIRFCNQFVPWVQWLIV